MKGLVIYDSKYGNTEKVAQAIYEVLDKGEGVRLSKVDQATPQAIPKTDLLIIGGPTHAWRPSKPIRAFLKELKSQDLSGVQAAAFDTGFSSRFSGSAAKKIEKKLKRAGCIIIAPATRFLVKDTEGPLEKGELDKAREWAKKIRSSFSPSIQASRIN